MQDTKSCGPFSCKASSYYTLLLVLINVILFADQNLLAPVLTPVAIEFGFVETYANGSVIMECVKNDTDFCVEPYKEIAKVDSTKRDEFLGSYITLAFFMIGGICSLGVGYLTDSVNRRNTLAVVVVLGETSCLATYFTTTYEGLFVCRALTGVAIGGAIPLMFSMFADLFDESNRGKAVAAAGVAMGVGAGMGQVLAGPVAGEDGSNWRMSFVIVAVPAYFLVALLLLTVPEPARGTMEKSTMGTGANYSEKISWAKFKALFKVRTIVLVFLQGIPGSLPWGVMLGFFNDFLIVEKNVSRSLSGLVVLSFGLGATLGQIIGGYAADKLRDRKKWIPIMMGSTTICGAFPIWALINMDPQSVGTYMMFSLPSGLIIGITGAAVKVILMNVTLPEVRGSAFAVFNLFDDIGKGGGVFAVGMIIKLADDRTTGLNYALIGWIVCGLVHFFMYFSIEEDYENCQKRLKMALDGTSNPSFQVAPAGPDDFKQEV